MSAPRGLFDSRRRSLLQGLASAGALAAAWPARSLAGALVAGKPSALVIGAGIAGLSAAYELRKAGFDVAIFEKERFTGGRMVELQMGPLYQFTHAVGVFEANREMFDLAGELGIADELRGPEALSLRDNGHGIYPYGLYFDLAQAQSLPGLSDDTRKRLPVLMADLEEMRDTVDPCLIATGASQDDETLLQYYERKLGKEAAGELIRYWIDPVCEAWGWPPHMTSTVALLPWFAQLGVKFVFPKGGIAVLTRKLGGMLPVMNETTVRMITPPDANGRHTVHYLTPQHERKSVTPDVVVCATEGKYLARLIQGMSPKQETFCRDIYFTKEAAVCYILDERAAPPMRYGTSYVPSHPDPVKARIGSWSVSPGDPAKGRPPVARIHISRPETPKWQASNTPLSRYCLPMMQYVYPALRDESVIKDIVDYTCDDLIYIPVGYVRRMADVLNEQSSSKRGLYIAGECVAGAHTGAACASGRTVARQIIRHWA
jgi:oxygen-dependent protoporphyrinogen oxidase